MIFNNILPWIFLFIVAIFWFVPTSKIKHNLILILLGMQIIFCIIALALSASNISAISKDEDSITFYLNIAAIIVSILFIFISIWRRLSVAKETIFGN